MGLGHGAGCRYGVPDFQIKVVDAEFLEERFGFIRRQVDEVTIFKSLGLAVKDVAAASLACRRALERRIGRSVER